MWDFGENPLENQHDFGCDNMKANKEVGTDT